MIERKERSGEAEGGPAGLHLVWLRQYKYHHRVLNPQVAVSCQPSLARRARRAAQDCKPSAQSSAPSTPRSSVTLLSGGDLLAAAAAPGSVADAHGLQTSAAAGDPNANSGGASGGAGKSSINCQRNAHNSGSAGSCVTIGVCQRHLLVLLALAKLAEPKCFETVGQQRSLAGITEEGDHSPPVSMLVPCRRYAGYPSDIPGAGGSQPGVRQPPEYVQLAAPRAQLHQQPLTFCMLLCRCRLVPRRLSFASRCVCSCVPRRHAAVGAQLLRDDRHLIVGGLVVVCVSPHVAVDERCSATI